MKKRIVLCVFLAVLFSTFVVNAQECDSRFGSNLGADLVSRYLWRGAEYGQSPSIQPYFSINYNLKSAGIIEFGGWASYELSGSFTENDLYIKYSYITPRGCLISLSINDYYFPHLGIPFNTFKGNGNGAHTIDFIFEYNGPVSFPISLLVSNLLYNDYPDYKSLYLEAGYSFGIGDVATKIHLGAAQGVSDWHGVSTDQFEFVNVGLTFDKEVKITEEYSLPVSASYILNWHAKKSYLVFKMSL